jgi:hypothetical protein
VARRGLPLLLVPLLGLNLAWATPRQEAPPVSTQDRKRVTIAAEKAGGSYRETPRYQGANTERWACVDVLESNPYAEPEVPVPTQEVLDYGALDPNRLAIRRYWVECTNLDTGELERALGFLYQDEVVDFDREARLVAARLLEQRVAPAIAVGSAPAGRALVGFESWFWVAGYDGAPQVEAFDVFGRRLVLELRAVAVRWDFGDGTVAALGPGDGFGSPEGRSAVAHRYRARSTSGAAPDATVTVAVEVDVAVSYTLDGAGPFAVDPPLLATASTDLVVREAQAVIS